MDDFYCTQVIARRLEVEIVDETSHVLAFKHTNPYWVVHLVVVPKYHIESIDKLAASDQPMVADAMRIIGGIAARLRAGYGGCTVATNVGNHQSTKHLHWYIHAGARIRDESGSLTAQSQTTAPSQSRAANARPPEKKSLRDADLLAAVERKGGWWTHIPE